MDTPCLNDDYLLFSVFIFYIFDGPLQITFCNFLPISLSKREWKLSLKTYVGFVSPILQLWSENVCKET